jgi:hypothetical protein
MGAMDSIHDDGVHMRRGAAGFSVFDGTVAFASSGGSACAYCSKGSSRQYSQPVVA